MGVRHVANGNGTVTQYDADTGRELVTFPDPDGSFTREHLEPAAAAPAGSVTSMLVPGGAGAGGAGVGGAGQPGALDTNGMSTFRAALAASPANRPGGQQPGAGAGPVSVLPDVSNISPGQPESEFSSALKPPQSAAEAGAESDARSAAVAPRAGASRLPLASETTTGLADPEGFKAQLDRLNAQWQEHTRKQEQAESAQLDARKQRVEAESDRALGRYATDLENHERAKASLLEAEDFAKQVRATPIDPGQALGGNKFLYAIMAGVGAQISKFGDALLGIKGNQDTNLVDDIIADSVRQQMADRQLKVEGAQNALHAARDQELRLSVQANASLEKWFDAKAAVEKDPEARAAWASEAEARRAAVDRDVFKLGEVGYAQRTQVRAAPKPVKGAGAGALLNAETKEDLAALAENGITQKQLTEYGTERAKTGADSTLKHVSDMRQLVKALTQPGSTDIPGVGPIDERTQALLRSNDASKIQQARGFLVSAFTKSRSGAAVTDKEREYLNNIVQGTGSNQVESLENGLRGLESEANTALDTLNRGNPGAARAYDRISANQSKRARLSEADASNLAAQRAGREKPAAETAPSGDTSEAADARYLASLTPEQRRAELEKRRQREGAALDAAQVRATPREKRRRSFMLSAPAGAGGVSLDSFLGDE